MFVHVLEYPHKSKNMQTYISFWLQHNLSINFI
jgi:hypothetical protein